MKRARQHGRGDALDLRIVEDQVVVRRVNEVVGESDVFALDSADVVDDGCGRAKFVHSLQLVVSTSELNDFSVDLGSS